MYLTTVSPRYTTAAPVGRPGSAAGGLPRRRSSSQRTTMDDELENSGPPTIVDTWLEPLGDPPCGEDLEWDNDFLEMTQAAAGKPGTQFSDDKDAVPPDWRSVQRLAESLFERTRDVRVAIYWARAQVYLESAATLADSFRLIHGLLDRYWDDVHPRPDDGDAYARVNALNDMASVAGLLGDMRNGAIVSNRAVGELRGRDIEVALGMLEPRDGDSQMGSAQIEQMLSEVAADDPAAAAVPGAGCGVPREDQRADERARRLWQRAGPAAADRAREGDPGADAGRPGVDGRRWVQWFRRRGGRQRLRRAGGAPGRGPRGWSGWLRRVARGRAARDRPCLRLSRAHRADQPGPVLPAPGAQAGRQELSRAGARTRPRVARAGGPHHGGFVGRDFFRGLVLNGKIADWPAGPAGGLSATFT